MKAGTSSVGELAAAFLRLGTVAFGGPAAHLAMMQDEFVRRRKWLTAEEFVDMIGAANLVPGPNSTEVAIHIGRRRGGALGMAVAGVCFILPAALIVSAIAEAYVRYGSLPRFQDALYGIKPVVVAVVAQAIWLLVGKVVDTWPKRIAFGVAFILSLANVNQLVVLLGSGFVLGGNEFRKKPTWRMVAPVFGLLAGVAAFAAFPLMWEALRQGSEIPTPWAVFLYFLKLGSVLYGSGYVLLSFLQGDLVAHYGWLSKTQLFDAVAVGQFTPGPVFTTATFIGYVLAGPLGALAGTVGIFLPSFFFVALGGRLLPSLRRTPVSSGLLDGVNAAALALMAAVLLEIGRSALHDGVTVAIASLSLYGLIRTQANSALLIALGGIAGLLASAIR